MNNKLLLISVVLLAQISKSYSQEGIGKFKIAKTTTNYIDTFALENKYEKVYANYFGAKYEYKNIVVELNQKSGYRTHYCPSVKQYYIGKLEISGIYVHNMKLTFFNDTLVDIVIDYSSEIHDILDFKYGLSKNKTTEEITNCVYNYSGREVSYKDVIRYYKWSINNIDICATLSSYRDNECKKVENSYIHFSKNDDTYKKIKLCDDNTKEILFQERRKEKEKELKEKSKNF